MHQLIDQIDAVARACYRLSGAYPQHLYVGPRTAQNLKKIPAADAVNPRQSTDVPRGRVIGMRIHVRMFLADRVITSVQPLADDELRQQFPTTEEPYAQDFATT